MSDLYRMGMSDLLTKQEAADYLRTTTRTIDRYRKRGKLKAVRVGKRVLFRRRDLDAALMADEQWQGRRRKRIAVAV